MLLERWRLTSVQAIGSFDNGCTGPFPCCVKGHLRARPPLGEVEHGIEHLSASSRLPSASHRPIEGSRDGHRAVPTLCTSCYEKTPERKNFAESKNNAFEIEFSGRMGCSGRRRVDRKACRAREHPRGILRRRLVSSKKLNLAPGAPRQYQEHQTAIDVSIYFIITSGRIERRGKYKNSLQSRPHCSGSTHRPVISHTGDKILRPENRGGLVCLIQEGQAPRPDP